MLKVIVQGFLLLVLMSVGQSLLAQKLDTLSGGIVRLDDYRAPDGAYVFWPLSRTISDSAGFAAADSLGLVVFLHGYGALNPLNYGGWIRHIVEQGNVVIYPRYQRNLVLPGSKAFAKTAHAGISTSLRWLASSALPVCSSEIIYVGHSYGGVIAANLLARHEQLDLPRGFGAVLAAPGTSRLRGSRLNSYSGIDSSTQLILVSHAGDDLVGDEFARLVFETVPSQTPVLWLPQVEEDYGEERLGQGHNECYALDEAFDSGYRNYTTRRALRIGCTDDLDLQLFWPLVDEMLAARDAGRVHRVIASGDNYFPLGEWADGQPRRAIELRYRNDGSLRPVEAVDASPASVHVEN